MKRMDEYEQEELNEQIKQWLKKGNKITKLPAGVRTDPEEMQYKTKWGRKKKTAKKD